MRTLIKIVKVVMGTCGMIKLWCMIKQTLYSSASLHMELILMAPIGPMSRDLLVNGM